MVPVEELQLFLKLLKCEYYDKATRVLYMFAVENFDIKLKAKDWRNTMAGGTEVAIVSEENMHDKIYNIRGQKVMLDFELAEIYGYETKNFNRQVKNNLAKFEGEDFMFQLSKDEWENLRCKNFTSSWGGLRYLPMAFTEQGIYMLMTVLRGELAIKQSRALVRTFKKMKDYIIDNRELIGQREYI